MVLCISFVKYCRYLGRPSFRYEVFARASQVGRFSVTMDNDGTDRRSKSSLIRPRTYEPLSTTGRHHKAKSSHLGTLPAAYPTRHTRVTKTPSLTANRRRREYFRVRCQIVYKSWVSSVDGDFLFGLVLLVPCPTLKLSCRVRLAQSTSRPDTTIILPQNSRIV